MTDHLPTLLTAAEAAAFLRVSTHTLENQRCTGTGPDWIKLPNGRVRYRAADLAAWVEAGR